MEIRVKELIKKYKKSIIKLLFAIIALILFSALATVVLIACGVLYYDDGVQINVHIFDSFTNSWIGGIVFILLQIFCTTVLCFLPGTTMMFIVLGQALYSEPWQAFLIVFAGVIVSSTAMYLVGRLGGYKICAKLLGEEDCEKATSLLRNKGSVFFPIMMLFPMFPDDALVMISGTLKMKLEWFFPSIIVGRGVGIATIVFGLSAVPFEKFTEWWHWALFVAICAILVVAVFLFALWFSKYMKKRNKG